MPPEYSEKKREYNIKYQKEKMKRIPLDVQLSDYERIKTTCDFLEIPVNTFIKNCVFSRLTELEKAGIIPAKEAVTDPAETKPK